ncbi:hypothetical protein G9A89_018269 [Geosiphon pyriformis]|nr:hypothetical protein G9A89_018269 [Geosiphon pyriformis]
MVVSHIFKDNRDRSSNVDIEEATVSPIENGTNGHKNRSVIRAPKSITQEKRMKIKIKSMNSNTVNNRDSKLDEKPQVDFKLQLKKNSSLKSTVHPLQPVLQSLFRLQKVILKNQNKEIVLPYACSFLTECEVYGVCKWDANQFDVKSNDLIRYVQLQRIVVFRLYGHKRENFKKKVIVQKNVLDKNMGHAATKPDKVNICNTRDIRVQII